MPRYFNLLLTDFLLQKLYEEIRYVVREFPGCCPIRFAFETESLFCLFISPNLFLRGKVGNFFGKRCAGNFLKNPSMTNIKATLKGQLISKCPFSAFKSPKKTTNF